MSSDAYRAIVKSLGLTPCRPSHDGATLHRDRQGEVWRVEDPERFSPERRLALIELLKLRMGVTTH